MIKHIGYLSIGNSFSLLSVLTVPEPFNLTHRNISITITIHKKIISKRICVEE